MHERNGTKSIILCALWTGKGVDDEKLLYFTKTTARHPSISGAI